jgi:hypothetical protein
VQFHNQNYHVSLEKTLSEEWFLSDYSPSYSFFHAKWANFQRHHGENKDDVLFELAATIVHVAPLGHIILIPSQPVFVLTPLCCVCLAEKQQIPIYNIVSNPRSIALETGTLTITLRNGIKRCGAK